MLTKISSYIVTKQIYSTDSQATYFSPFKSDSRVLYFSFLFFFFFFMLHNNSFSPSARFSGDVTWTLLLCHSHGAAKKGQSGKLSNAKHSNNSLISLVFIIGRSFFHCKNFVMSNYGLQNDLVGPYTWILGYVPSCSNLT